MRTVDIKNLSGRRQIIHLPHQVVCVKVGRCFCRNGSSATVHLSANGVAMRIPAEVVNTPDCRRLLKLKPLVKVVPSKENASQAAAPSQLEAPKGKSGKRSSNRKKTTADDN